MGHVIAGHDFDQWSTKLGKSEHVIFPLDDYRMLYGLRVHVLCIAVIKVGVNNATKSNLRDEAHDSLDQAPRSRSA